MSCGSRLKRHPDWLPTFAPVLLGLMICIVGLGVLQGWTLIELLVTALSISCTILPLPKVQVALMGLNLLLIGLQGGERLSLHQSIEFFSIAAFLILTSRFLRDIEWRLMAQSMQAALTDTDTTTPNALITHALTSLKYLTRADAAIALRQLDPVTAEALVCLPPNALPDQLTTPALFETALAQNRCLYYTDYPSTPDASHVLLAQGTQSFAVLPLLSSTANGGAVLLIWYQRYQLSSYQRRLIESLLGQLRTLLKFSDTTLRLDKLQARFSAMLETIHQGVIFVDESGEQGWLNQAAAEKLGLNPGTVEPPVLAQAMATLRSSADNQAEIATQAAQFFSHPQTEIRHWNWVFTQPQPRVLSISSTPTRVRDVPGRLWILDDITEQYYGALGLVASTQKLSQANLELKKALLQAEQVTRELRQQTERVHQSEGQLRVALEEVQRQNRRSQLFADMTLKIRQSLKLEEILQTTVKEVQKLLSADRVLIFRLQSNGFGQIVTEAVVPGLPSVIEQNITDGCFGPDYLKKYQQGRIYTITDIDRVQVEPCLIEFMKQLSIKAKLVMPILLKEQLWGLLIAHQCTHPRQWSSFEIELLRQLADQIGIALAQAQLLAEETRQRQELARSNTELQQFAYIASHDLQEPLRKIQAFGHRLKEKCSDSLPEQGRDYIERMQNAAFRMQSLINDLLTLSRVLSKAQPLVLVNLAQVVQEVLSDLEFQIQQTQGHVEVGELPTIKADPLQMRQLLQNLISNALKFHRSGVPPVVKLYHQIIAGQGSEAGELCQILVEDNGIGFDEKYLDRIFNVFQRLHGRSEYEGTGMGLAICRKIAEHHSGSITAKSQVGRGATFIVTLPLKTT